MKNALCITMHSLKNPIMNSLLQTHDSQIRLSNRYASVPDYAPVISSRVTTAWDYSIKLSKEQNHASPLCNMN